MKKIIIILCLFLTNICFGQLDHMPLMVGNTDIEVIHYLDSLNKLKANPYYKVIKDMTPDGELMLRAEYSLYDEEFYTCLYVRYDFMTVGVDKEICVGQMVMGHVEYAENNMRYVRQNFKNTSSGHWERPVKSGAPYKITVDFERKEGQYPMYLLTYQVKKTEETH